MSVAAARGYIFSLFSKSNIRYITVVGSYRNHLYFCRQWWILCYYHIFCHDYMLSYLLRGFLCWPCYYL